MRPLFVLAACEAVGGEWRRALPAAAAVECVHCFSLVHDDLPAMDDDDFRRGRPTTHRKFGEALGLLAGDALLALAFEELSRLAARGVSPGRVVEAVRVLARVSGSRELVAGQALDLAAEGRRTAAREVRAIHERKTGALMAGALEIGAIVGGAGASRRREFARLGRSLGVAFQIHDDLLDRHAPPRRSAGRARADVALRKATWPRAVGERRARGDAARRFARALVQAEALGRRGRVLAELIRAVADRRG